VRKHQNKAETAPLPNLTQKSVISFCDILTAEVTITITLSLLYQMTMKIFIVIQLVRKINSGHFPKRHIGQF
jgi:hypothetical protein